MSVENHIHADLADKYVCMKAERNEAIARLAELKAELDAERKHVDDAAWAVRSGGTVAVKLWLREYDDRRGART